jgi:hypothetical protein
MGKIVYLIFLLLINLTVFSIENNKKYFEYKGKFILYKKKNITDSCFLYINKMQKLEYKNGNDYFEFASFYNVQNVDSNKRIIFFLDKAFEYGITNDNISLIAFKKKLSSIRLNIYENKLKKIKASILFPTIKDKLINLNNDDQYIRKLLNKVISQEYGINSIKYDSLLRVQKKIDLKNEIEIIKIVSEIGIPTIDKVGYFALTIFFNIVQHNSIYNQKIIYELLTHINKQQILKNRIAYLYDRIAYIENRKQRYGTQFVYHENIDKWVLYDIENDDINYLDSIRSINNLLPINISIDIFNIDSPIKFILK